MARNDTDDLLYAEFTDVKEDWNFTAAPNFYELYDLDADPHMLHNAYGALTNGTLKAELHDTLLELFACRGSPDTDTDADAGAKVCN